MPKLRTGISQIGGKFRLCNKILDYVPYHEFFLSLFCGACWVEINKPRCRYECFNDYDSEIINYLVMAERYPDEFDAMKQGVYGLVSQEICNRIVRGELQPRNDLERAYFFYYLNKLTFGGDVKKIGDNKEDEHAHQCGIMRPTDPIRKPQVEKIKEEWKTKGYTGLINNQALTREGYGLINKETVEQAKEDFAYKTKGFGGMGNPRAGLPTLHQEDIEKIKEDYNKTNAQYCGLLSGNLGGRGGSGHSGAVKQAKEEYQKKVNLPIFSSGIGGGDGAGNDGNIQKAKASYKGVSANASQAYRKRDLDKTKASFAGINNTRAGNNASNMRDMEKWKDEFQETVEKGLEQSSYRGVVLPTVCKDKSVNDAKSSFKAQYGGIFVDGTGARGVRKEVVEQSKQQYQAVAYKGINPKTTRPYHNNDCGLLTPLNPKAIERLRYVNLTCYPFQKVYKLFYEAFHVRKGLSRECFIFADPPYPTTEKYYGNKFLPEYHQELIDLMLKTPFNFMLTIGSECEMYLEQLSDWVIVPVKVRYSTDATSQSQSQEYIIMNYEVNEIKNMQEDNQTSLMRFIK